MKTILIGGEAVTSQDIKPLGKDTQITIIYGPSECTPMTTFHNPSGSEDVAIGRGIGVNTWIADPNDVNRLSPVGVVGELCLEGPLVGDGYLNDPQKTAAAFIKSPSWLKCPQRRIYRTGDLVRYTDDGSGAVLYVRRKDSQVKIRGQRVELAEVEHHVHNAFQAVSEKSHKGDSSSDAGVEVVSEVINVEETGNMMLIAFITPATATRGEAAHNRSVRLAATEVTRVLSRMIPSYMVPSVFIPLQAIPTTITGKVDRVHLREIGIASWRQNGTNVDGEDNIDNVAQSPVEHLLRTVWATVLNFPAHTIALNRAFTSLGGDSITAMQVVSLCRKQHVGITVTNVLQAGTIRKLALECRTFSNFNRKDSAQDTIEIEEAGGTVNPFGLTPIQKYFFDLCPEGMDHFNQSFLLDLNQDVSVVKLQTALQAVVDRHDMLRARYQKDEEGNWEQYIAAAESTSSPSVFTFQKHHVSERAHVLDLAQKQQTRLRTNTGPMFSADYFHVDGEAPILLLSAHHLVIDLVSWRILWRDIEDYIRDGHLTSAEAPTFRRWHGAQERMAAQLKPGEVLPFAVPPSNIAFWGLNWGDQIRERAQDQTMYMDSKASKLLMGKSNNALRSEPLDVILGVYAYSFKQAFSERELPTVFLESHGREMSESSNLDISGTVGWFTTIHPVPIHVRPEHSVIDSIRLMKDTRRRIPSKGHPYFASRFYSDECQEAFRGHNQIEVIINFAGAYQQLESGTGLFRLARPFEDGRTLEVVSPRWTRLALIEINMGMRNGKLEMIMTIDKHMKHRERLQVWFRDFVREMGDVAGKLDKVTPSLTHTDLPLLSLSDQGLDRLINQQLPAMGVPVQDLVDAYPASPLQEGILLSASRGASSYDTFWIWKCTSPLGAVSSRRLAEAWRTVVRRHPILSTVFGASPEARGFVQFVLADPHVDITQMSIDSGDPSESLYRLERIPRTSESVPKHAFTICESPTGLACRLDINHLLLDGGSLTPLVRDLVAAYSGLLFSPAPSFKSMVQYIQDISHKDNISWWSDFLRGAEPCEVVVEPKLSSYSTEDAAFHYTPIPADALTNILSFCKQVEITRSAFLQVAWAMVLSCLTSRQEVCFGYLASGRDAPIDDIGNMIGPLANMLISRVDLKSSAGTVLQRTADSAIQHLSHQHVSLAEIQHSIGLPSGQRLFNTAMTVRESDRFESHDSEAKIAFEYVDHQDPHEYDLLLSARIQGEEMSVSLQTSQGRHLGEEVAGLLAAAIECLLTADETAKNGEGLHDLFRRHPVFGASEADKDRIWRWNSPLPEPIEECVHHLIRRAARESPEAPAICAWDGEMTYRQMEDESTSLALRLMADGVQRNMIIPLCFEKSMWMPIAALAVMKTGAAVVALDVTQPETRLRSIASQLGSSIILTSFANKDLAQRLGGFKVLPVGSTDLLQPSPAFTNSYSLPIVDPSSLLYLAFTSGSTGTPKGTQLTHTHVSTMLHYQSHSLGLTRRSRVYNFASYAFDVAWDDLFHALTVGGCLCVPSETDRKENVEASMVKLRANYAHITPTLLRHVEWEKVTGIKVVNLSGEPVLPSDRDILGKAVRVINAYGPAETNVVTVQDLDALKSEEVSIGKGAGACTWVVDQNQGEVLVPVGKIGELWIEGPLAGEGYLEDEEKSRKMWVEDPKWLVEGTSRWPGRSGRLYRTGDLVRYQDDGSLVYVGRADRQIKIRGQRVELGEIETAARHALTTAGQRWQVTVDAVQLKGNGQSVLVAFLSQESTHELDEELHTRQVHESVESLSKYLTSVLPEYMIPRAYIPIRSAPTTATGKVDRQRLQELAATKTIQEWARKQTTTSSHQRPLTEAETQMRSLWAAVLEIETPSIIGLTDDFFRIGGDSIRAMLLVRKALDQQLSLTVKNVFQKPILSDLAALNHSCEPSNSSDRRGLTRPIEIPATAANRKVAAQLCGLREDQIVDFMMCTPLQRSLMTWTTESEKPDFRSTHTLKVGRGIDLDRLKDAWKEVVQRNAVLRTRIVEMPEFGFVQVVCSQGITWVEANSVVDSKKQLESRSMGMGSRLVQFALVTDVATGSMFFSWELHWAIYDGWCLRMLLAEAETIYQQTTPEPLTDMRAFTKYVQSRDDAEAALYWEGQFTGLSAACHFPPRPANKSAARPRVDHDMRSTLYDVTFQATSFTAATFIRTALSIVLARNLDSSEAVFGATVTGRQASVAGLEHMAGPAFTTLPIRVSFDREKTTVQELLERVQSQAAEMIPFEQTPLEKIREVGPEARQACDFRVLLVVQPAIARGDPRRRRDGLESIFEDGLMAGKDAIVELGRRSGKEYPMFVELQMGLEGEIHLRVRVDSREIEEKWCRRIVCQLEDVLCGLAAAVQQGRTGIRVVDLLT